MQWLKPMKKALRLFFDVYLFGVTSHSCCICMSTGGSSSVIMLEDRGEGGGGASSAVYRHLMKRLTVCPSSACVYFGLFHASDTADISAFSLWHWGNPEMILSPKLNFLAVQKKKKSNIIPHSLAWILLLQWCESDQSFIVVAERFLWWWSCFNLHTYKGS